MSGTAPIHYRATLLTVVLGGEGRGGEGNYSTGLPCSKPFASLLVADHAGIRHRKKPIEKDRVVCMALVDLQKAYDNVNRLKLWTVLEELVLKEDYYKQFRHWMRMERQE